MAFDPRVCVEGAGPYHAQALAAHDHHELDWATEAARLERWVEIERDLHSSIVGWLAVPAGATVVDVGCGAGVMTEMLARAVGPSGTVVAVDGEAAMLAATESLLGEASTGARIRTLTVDLDDPDWPKRILDAAGRSPQLVWASSVVHHLADEVGVVGQMTGLLAPRGALALAEGGLPLRWCSVDLGLDEPGLQARIAAASETWFRSMRAAIPGTVDRSVSWPEALASSGLAARSRSFLLDHPAPLSEAGRRYVADHLLAAAEQLSEADRSAIEALGDDTDPRSVARRADAFVLAARTVHVGTKTV